MSRYRIRLGKKGEAIARRHLLQSGYRVLTQNWRTRRGEIDLIAQKGDVLVFVEVKSRSSHKYGRPEEAVTAKKRQRLVRAARAYLQAKDREDTDWRIDVIAVDVDENSNLVGFEHFEDVIQGS